MPSLQAELLNLRGVQADRLSNGREAARWFREELELTRQKWPDRGVRGWLGGTQARVRARAALNLSGHLALTGDIDEAKALHEETVEILESEFGPTSVWLFGALKAGCEVAYGIEYQLAACKRALALAETRAWYSSSIARKKLLPRLAAASCALGGADCGVHLRQATDACPSAGACGTEFLNLLLLRFRVSAAQGRIKEARALADEAAAVMDANRAQQPEYILRQLDAVSLEIKAKLSELGGDLSACVEHGHSATKAWKRAQVQAQGYGRNGHHTSASCLLALGGPESAVTDARIALAIMDDNDSFLREIGETRFILAKAILQSGGDKAEAIAEAKQAADELAQRLPGALGPHLEVLAWLKEHDK